ncbi:MAG: hypothetical protein IJM15_03500 [Erysipelotrichaceae bacterium]|nr:hypothetical protein [Erysipelotrichaceae bacterium]
MKTVFELTVFCGIFTFLVKLFAGNDPRGCLYFYPKDYQKKAYELKLADRDAVLRNRKIFLGTFTPAMLVVLVVIIRCVNGITGYWEAYFQSLLFLEVMNWYDGIVIDRIWVGHDPFWKIEGIDLPYVQTWKQVLIKRGILSLIWIIMSFVTAGIICLL